MLLGQPYRAWIGPAIRTLVPLAALAIEGLSAAIGTLLAQELGLFVARRVGEGARQAATRLFLLAYTVRMVVALPTHYRAKVDDGNGALFLDDYTNDLVGEWLVRIGQGEGLSIFRGHQHLLEGAYPYLLMGLYAVFGHTPLLPKVVNVVLAALTAVLVFEITRRMFRPPAAVVAGLGAALLPTVLVWSVASLKESLVLFVAVLGLWGIQRLGYADRAEQRINAALVILAAIALSLDLRSTSSLILAGLVGILALARLHDARHPWRLPLATIAVVALVGSGALMARSVLTDRPLAGVLEDVVLQIRHRRAQEAAGARTQIRTIDDAVSPEGSVLPAAEAASDAAPFSLTGDVIEPLGYALLSPAPWQARDLVELVLSAEMLGWYALLALAGLFAWRSRSDQPLMVLCLVAFGVANWLVLAASEGNLGNLVRHRVMLAPTVLMLGAGGLQWLWRRAAPA